MSESDASEISQKLDYLRQVGADKFDPVRFHYLEVLARRANSHPGDVKRHLEGKLALALVTLRERFAQAQADTRQAVEQLAPQYPQAAADLQLLLTTGDVAAVKQGIARLTSSGNGSLLGELTRHLAHQRPHDEEASLKGLTGRRPELKTAQYFRNTWAKISVDKRVTQAIHQAPKNAGPINSHMLVLRSLALMREISPDYLNRLTSYVDTLLCLDQLDKKKLDKPRLATAVASGKRIGNRRSTS